MDHSSTSAGVCSFEGNGVIKNCHLSLERERKLISMTQTLLPFTFDLIYELVPHVWLSIRLNNLIAGNKSNRKKERKKERKKDR